MIDSDICSSKLHFSFFLATVIHCPILNSVIFQERSLIFIFLSCLCVCDLHLCMGVCLGLSVCIHLCSGPRLMLWIILHCSTFFIEARSLNQIQNPYLVIQPTPGILSLLFGWKLQTSSHIHLAFTWVWGIQSTLTTKPSPQHKHSGF